MQESISLLMWNLHGHKATFYAMFPAGTFISFECAEDFLQFVGLLDPLLLLCYE